MVKEVIAKEPFPAPKVTLDPSITNFYDFTVDSFTVENYEYHTLGKKIPVAV
jgi:thymidylate synthase